MGLKLALSLVVIAEINWLKPRNWSIKSICQSNLWKDKIKSSDCKQTSNVKIIWVIVWPFLIGQTIIAYVVSRRVSPTPLS